MSDLPGTEHLPVPSSSSEGTSCPRLLTGLGVYLVRVGLVTEAQMTRWEQEYEVYLATRDVEMQLGDE